MKKYSFLLGALMAAANYWPSSVDAQEFNKAEFYGAMKSGDPIAIDRELKNVQVLPPTEQQAYSGALLIRRADFQRRAKDKLREFRQGRIALQNAINAEPDNAEFHFLRLAIEEHAPKILKYRRDIAQDKAIVISNFSHLAPAVRHAIRDYSETSKVLRPKDF